MEGQYFRIIFASVNNNKQLPRTRRPDNKRPKTKMKKQALINALTAVAALNPEGYTVDARTLQPVTTGYAVAVAATQNSFNAEGLAAVVDYVSTHGDINAFGGWRDSQTGNYYYDATIIVSDKAKAIELGRLNNQLAIFDLANLEEIRL